MTWNLGSVALYALDRVPEASSAVSGLPMQRFAETIIYDLQNYTGETISTTGIPTKYRNILVNLTAAYALGFQNGLGVDRDFELGEFKVSGGKGDSALVQSMNVFLRQGESNLKYLGKKIHFAKARG